MMLVFFRDENGKAGLPEFPPEDRLFPVQYLRYFNATFGSYLSPCGSLALAGLLPCRLRM